MNPAVVIIIIVLILVAARVVYVRYLPNPACWWCKGTGKRWFSNRKRSGPCFFCGGSGKRKPRGEKR